MKIWVDNSMQPPNWELCTDEYVWCSSLDAVKNAIEYFEEWFRIEIIDIGWVLYINDDNTYIDILEWLEETGRKYPIRIHSTSSIVVENIRQIIQKNGWTEVI